MNQSSSLGTKIKKSVMFLLRPELNTRSKISNAITVVALVAQIPTTIITTCLDGFGWGTISEIVMIAVLSAFLWVINQKPNEMWPITIMLILVDYILFPFMFFYSGGRRAGMLIWMVLLPVIAATLLRGKTAMLFGMGSIVTAAVCLVAEFFHPENMHYYSTPQTEISDIIISFAIVVAIIFSLFKFQTYLFEEEHRKLEEKEKQLEKTNEQLERASKAKTDFLANMSHEIRTPINAVLGMDEMILRDCKDSDILSYAADIDAAGRQLLSIISDVLDFSKIESGRLDIVETEYDMYSMMNDCFNLVAARANAKGLELKIENDPRLPAALIGDEIRIRQMIINYLTNAIKYTDGGSVLLRFDCEKLDDTHINLCVSVKDTGIGITPENMERLFGTFNRIDEKAHRNIEGTGLGLAITRQLARLMNGETHAESVYGEGSTFFFTVPQEIASDKPIGEYDISRKSVSEVRKAYKQKFTASDAHILVVDDVRVNLNVVRLLLRDTLVQMDLVESGEAALDMMHKKHYDLVLMDHMMPEMDGIETLHRARGDKDVLDPEVPMIALTANAIQGADEMYYKEGFCDYITKPIKAEELEKALMKYLPQELINIT